MRDRPEAFTDDPKRGVELLHGFEHGFEPAASMAERDEEQHRACGIGLELATEQLAEIGTIIGGLEDLRFDRWGEDAEARGIGAVDALKLGGNAGGAGDERGRVGTGVEFFLQMQLVEVFCAEALPQG